MIRENYIDPHGEILFLDSTFTRRSEFKVSSNTYSPYQKGLDSYGSSFSSGSVSTQAETWHFNVQSIILGKIE